MARMPLAPLALAFATGIAVGRWVDVRVAIALGLLALAGSGSLLLLGRLRSAASLLLVAAAAAGVVRATPPPLPADHVGRLALPRTVHLEGRLAEEPRRLAPDRTRLLVDVTAVDGERRSGRARLTLYGDPAARNGEPVALTEGQAIAAGLVLHAAGGLRNPGSVDYGVILRREGIHVVGTVQGDRLRPLDAPPPPWRIRVRRAAVAAMGGTLPPASAALLAGLLLGDRAELPRDIDDAFRRAGVYHVLAVSGFNVALLASSVFALLALARVGRRAGAVIAMVVVIGFALVVGPEPSVVRAAIMAVLVLGALLLHRDASVTNGLALAALIILAVRPVDLLEPGFQLSFAATAGIVAAPVPRGVPGGGVFNAAARLLRGALVVSLAAQLAVLPISLAHFNQLSTIGPLANLAVVPLAGIVTVLGLLAVAISFATATAAAIAFDATWPMLIALRLVVALTARVPGALVHLPSPPAAAIACYGAALALGLAWSRLPGEHRRERRAAAIAAIALAGLAVGLAGWPLVRPPDGRFRVAVLDVGQGDAIVIETPGGHALLVDAGPGGPARFDAGERVVAPYLWSRGFLRLAAAVATHDDQDHAGGMPAVRRLLAVHDGLRLAEVDSERRWIDGVGILALGPPTLLAVDGGAPRPPTGNDAALILRVDYGAVSFLLGSDLTGAVERALIAARAPLRALVLKVPHHGARSSTSTALLRAVSPSIAVISAGSRNPYGHPGDETLGRLGESGAFVYRTDRDGAVLFETDGRELTVTRWATRSVDRYCLDPDRVC